MAIASLVMTSSAHSESYYSHLSPDAKIPGSDSQFAKYLYYSNKPSWKGQAKKESSDGKLLYDVFYTIDKERRRWNPYNQKNKAENNLLFVGCSVTFGEGLNDDQTIPAQITYQTHQTQTFNYGTNGYGPTHILSYFKYFDLAKHFNDSKKVKAIYLWGDYHFGRALGSLNHLSWGGDSAPYYSMAATGLTFTGSVSDAFPVRRLLSRILFGWPFVGNYLRSHFIDWPLNNGYSDEDIEFILHIIKEAKENYQSKFQNDNFYIAFLPYSDYSISKMQKRLNEMGVKTINLTKAWEGTDPSRVTIPGDGHPSAFGANLIARELIKELNLR